jgi:hypothetical protein
MKGRAAERANRKVISCRDYKRIPTGKSENNPFHNIEEIRSSVRSTGRRRLRSLRMAAREPSASGSMRTFISVTKWRGDCYLASSLFSLVLNFPGLHVYPTEDSGKSKSDSALDFFQIISAQYRVQD